MTRHILDQSALFWSDNLKLNGSQSHLEIREVTSSLFLFSAMPHTEVVFCSNNSSCFKKKKYYKSGFAKKTQNQARVLSVKRMAGVTQTQLSLFLSWFSALSVLNNKHTRSEFLSPAPRQLLSGAIISPNL